MEVYGSGYLDDVDHRTFNIREKTTHQDQQIKELK